jgi:hypothetical protein
MKWRPRIPRSRRARGLAAAAVVLGALGISAMLLWRARDAFAEYVAERFIAADVTISGMRPGNPLGVDYLGLRDPEDRMAPALLSAEDLRVTLAPSAERKVESVEVARLLLNLATTPERNYDFLLQMSQGEGRGGSDYLPRALRVENLTLGLESAMAGLHLDGLHASADLASSTSQEWRVSGEAVEGFWRIDAASSEKHDIAGALSLEARAQDGQWALQFTTQVPGLAQLAGEAQLRAEPLSIDAALQPGTLESPLWAQMLSDRTGVPVYFDKATISGGALQLASAACRLYAPALSLNLSTEAFRLGDAENPQYTGPLALDISGGSEEGIEGTVRLTLGDRPPLELALSQAPEGLRAALAETHWNRAQLMAVAPGTARGALEKWPGLQAAKIQGALLAGAEALYLQAEIAPEGKGGATATVEVEATKPTAAPAHGTIQARAEGGGAWSLAFTGFGADKWDAALQLDKTRTDYWVDKIFGYALPTGAHMTLTGTLDYAVTMDAPGALSAAVSAHMAPNLTLKLEAQAQHDTGSNRLSNLSGKLDAGPLGSFTLRKGRIDPAKVEADIGIKGTLALDEAARYLQWEGISGKGPVEGTVRLGGDGIRIDDLKASLAGLAAAGVELPMEPALTLTGSIARPADAIRADLQGAWGDLTFALAGLRFVSAKDWSATSLTLNAPMSSLVRLGFLAEGDGTLRLEANDAGNQGGSLATDIQGGFVLPDNLLAVKTLAWSPQGAMGPSVSAAGPLRAQEIAAFGLVLSALECNARIEGMKIHFDDIVCDLLGGRATGSADATFGGDTMPVDLDVQLENVDLAEFTRVFQPPNVELTGRASGRIRASIAGENITALEVALQSGEGFTLNRAMVAQILMQQQVGEFAGSGTVSKVVERVIGKEDRRPFTAAEIELGLQDGRITGVARLKSEALNLTVDIKADQGALFEAMRMRQEGQVAGFSTTFQ